MLCVLLGVTVWNFVADVGGWPLSMKSECNWVWDAEPRKPALSNCCCITSRQAPAGTQPFSWAHDAHTLDANVHASQQKLRNTSQIFTIDTYCFLFSLSTLVHDDVKKCLLFRSHFLIVVSTPQNDNSDLRYFCVHGMNTGWGCKRKKWWEKKE